MTATPQNFSAQVELHAAAAAAATIRHALIEAGRDCATPADLADFLRDQPVLHPKLPAAPPAGAAPAPEDVFRWVQIIEALLPVIEQLFSIFRRR